MTNPDAGHLDVDHAELALYLRDGSIVHLTNVQAVGTIVPVRPPDTEITPTAEAPAAVAGLERLDLTLTGFAWPDPDTGSVATVYLEVAENQAAPGMLDATRNLVDTLARHGAVYRTDQSPPPERPGGYAPSPAPVTPAVDMFQGEGR